MTTADHADEIETLRERLTDELTNLATCTNDPKKLRKVASLLSGLVQRGPSSFTVSHAAFHTGVSTTDYLHMTTNDQRWTNPPPTYTRMSQTLAAHHIFDTSAAQQVNSDRVFSETLESIGLTERFVTEATAEDPHVKKKSAASSVEQWAKIVRVSDADAMRIVEAIRLSMSFNDGKEGLAPDPMRRLGRAETIGTVLGYAHRGELARIVTAGPNAPKRYQKFGLIPTPIWDIFAEAFSENRLSSDEIGPLRALREKFDPTFYPNTNRWPRNSPTLPKPLGRTPN